MIYLSRLSCHVLLFITLAWGSHCVPDTVNKHWETGEDACHPVYLRRGHVCQRKVINTLVSDSEARSQGTKTR